MFDEMLTERQRAKLWAGECAVWAGRPKPTFWGEGNIFTVIFGAFWSTIIGFGVSQVGVSVWRNFAAEPSWAKFGAAIGITAFFTPFVCVGIGTLFSPLWRYIGMSMTRWAVTNRRLIRFAPFKATYWEADELTEDVETSFLDSLYPSDFPFAQAALKRLDDSIEDEDEEEEDEE